MTGTLKVLGANRALIEWDTDTPASVEAAKRAYAEAAAKGATPFDTTESTAKPMHGATTFDPGKATTPEDITMVPRFAGGA
jgi:hypothetical protein